MGNGRERSKREILMEEKEKLHYPEWIEALIEEERKQGRLIAKPFETISQLLRSSKVKEGIKWKTS